MLMVITGADKRGFVAHRVGGLNAHDWCGHKAHSARHLVAVLIQLIKCLIARLHKVHAHAVNLHGRGDLLASQMQLGLSKCMAQQMLVALDWEHVLRSC